MVFIIGPHFFSIRKIQEEEIWVGREPTYFTTSIPLYLQIYSMNFPLDIGV